MSLRLNAAYALLRASISTARGAQAVLKLRCSYFPPNVRGWQAHWTATEMAKQQPMASILAARISRSYQAQYSSGSIRRRCEGWTGFVPAVGELFPSNSD